MTREEWVTNFVAVGNWDEVGVIWDGRAKIKTYCSSKVRGFPCNVAR